MEWRMVDNIIGKVCLPQTLQSRIGSILFSQCALIERMTYERDALNAIIFRT